MSTDKHSGLRGMADRAEDMVGGMVGMTAAATTGSADRDQFLANATMGNIYEITSCRVALERARSPQVKELARLLIEDHVTATHQLKSTLRSIPDAPPPPTGLDDRRADMVDHLRKAPEDEFDDRFLEQQSLAHQENLTLFEGYADRGDDPRLKLFAASSIPAMRRHRERIGAYRSH